MDIKILIADTEIEKLSEKQYDAYVSELRARVKEVYPESHLVIGHCGDVTYSTASGFHDNDKVQVIIHELQQDVALHGYWLKEA